MSEPKGYCSNCRFFSGGELGYGVCHRYPPTVHPTDPEGSAIQPETDTDDWCGEWQAAEPTKPESTAAMEHFMAFWPLYERLRKEP